MIILYLILIYIVGIVLAVFSNIFVGIVEAWMHKVSEGEMEMSEKFCSNWMLLTSWSYVFAVIAYVIIMSLIIFGIMIYKNSFLKYGRRIRGWKQF